MKKTIQSINPYSGEINWEFELLSEKELDEKIKLADTAYKAWKNTSFEERKKLCLKLADILEKRQEECATIQTKEMWMLYSESFGWLTGTIRLIRWFADNAQSMLADEEFDHWEEIKGIYQYCPLGVIYWVWPRNLPFNQVLRAAVPNILAGNTTVYKHASNVPMCGDTIESLFTEAGFPEWVYQNIFISWRNSEFILAQKEIAWMNLTGGENAGKALWELTWKNLKPSVLELGGNDVFIVYKNSNLDAIVEQAVIWKMRNGGQICTSSKRFLVLEEYYDEFVKKFSKRMWELKVWDPMQEETQVQPICMQSASDEIDRQVQKTISQWAQCITGWKQIQDSGKGIFYAPTVLADVTENMLSYNEEIFWPVASIIKVKDLNEIIYHANNIDLWLWWCIFWDNHDELVNIAKQIETGMVYINKTVASKAQLPWWGIKKSGYWKENWAEGLKAFTNKKVILY